MNYSTQQEFYGLDMEATGKRIERYLDKCNLGDKDVAEIMNLSVQAINKWRHGHSIPDIDNLYLLSRILSVKVDDLLVSRVESNCSMIYDIESFSGKADRPRNLEAYCSMLSGRSGKKIHLGVYIYRNESIFRLKDSPFQLRVK